LLETLRMEGLTILLVEHDMDFVMGLVDRTVVMDFGAKLCEGAPAAVRRDPRVQEAYLGGGAGWRCCRSTRSRSPTTRSRRGAAGRPPSSPATSSPPSGPHARGRPRASSPR